MKAADIEARTELALGIGPQFADFELTDLVSQRLCGPDDVTINFHGDVLIRLGGIGAEEVNGLIARPSHRMQARIDDQPYRAPHLIREPAKLRVRILVKAHFLAERLRIEGPAFNKCGVAGVL